MLLNTASSNKEIEGKFSLFRQAHLRQDTIVVLNSVSHAMEMPSRMGLARSALKLISPLAEDLYTPFLAGLTVACIE